MHGVVDRSESGLTRLTRRARLSLTPGRPWRGLAAAALTGLIVLTGVACSPKYNWRTTSDQDGRYTAAFPAKTVQQAQKVSVNGVDLTMRMQTASVGNDVFAIGSMALPDNAPDLPALKAAALDLVTKGIAQNLAPDVPATPITLPATDGRALDARAWAARGTIPGTAQKRAVTARFTATDQRVYEAVILSDDTADATVAKTFFDGFKPF